MTKSDLINWLVGMPTPIILDGSWSMELLRGGGDTVVCAEQLNLVNPEHVTSLAARYVRAGSMLLTTNTFGANALNLARYGLGAHAHAINTSGVTCTRRVAHSRPVFGTIGPVFEFSRYAADQRSLAYANQARQLIAAGADGLTLETFTNPDEAALALGAALVTGVAVCALLAPTASNSGSIPQSALSLLSAGATAIGLNCGQGPVTMTAIVQEMVIAGCTGIWVRPNAGVPADHSGEWIYPVAPAEFARETSLLHQHGAAFLGGCCGAGPEHIAALAALVSA